MRNRSTITAVIFCGLAAMGISACGGDSTGLGNGNGNADIAGTYSLASVADGAAGAKTLPASFPTAGGATTFASGTLTIAANGTYTMTGPYTAGTVNLKLDDNGTFTRSGSGITLTGQFDPVSGTIDGSAISLNMRVTTVIPRGAFTFVFRK